VLNIIVNAHRSSCKVPNIFVRFLMKLDFLDIYSKNIQVSNFTKMRLVGADFHEDILTDRHDEANIRVSEFCKSA